MKTFRFLILLSLIQTKAFAQSSYVPFPEANAVWHVGYTLSPYPGYYHYQYFYDGDTAVSGKDYHKIRRTYEFVGPDPISGDDGILGYLRQDTSERKVYYLPKNGLQEELLYDFSIGEGEDYVYNCGIVEAENIELDSVMINGQYRRMWLNNGGGNIAGTAKMIEGIGYLSGLLGCFEDCFEHCWWLSCFQQDGETVYTDTFSSHLPVCNLIGLDDVEFLENEILFPNPVSEGEVTIQFATPENFEIFVYDLAGKLFLHEYRHYTSEAKLYIARFPKGVYTVRIFADWIADQQEVNCSVAIVCSHHNRRFVSHKRQSVVSMSSELTFDQVIAN